MQKFIVLFSLYCCSFLPLCNIPFLSSNFFYTFSLFILQALTFSYLHTNPSCGQVLGQRQQEDVVIFLFPRLASCTLGFWSVDDRVVLLPLHVWEWVLTVVYAKHMCKAIVQSNQPSWRPTIWQTLRVELLLLNIKTSQLRWFRNLAEWRFLAAFWIRYFGHVLPEGGRRKACWRDYITWLAGNTLMFTRISCRRWLGRGRSGQPCLGFYPCDLSNDNWKKWVHGWTDYKSLSQIYLQGISVKTFNSKRFLFLKIQSLI